MSGSTELHAIGEKTLQQKASSSLLSYCPSMDLVALGSKDQQVFVFRLNGQRVYGVAQHRGALKVEQVKWKPNGQLLAIAWSDGVIRLVGTESNKTVHQIPTASEASSITCIGWGSNFSSKKRAALLKKEQLRSEIAEQLPLIARNASLDLPRDLALLDIETTVPKLSTLPASGTADDVFSSQASLDGLFRPLDPKDDEIVDVLVAGTEDGQLHVSIYDSFIIGSFNVPISGEKPNGPAPRLLLHSCHQNYSTHGLLFRSGHPLAATLAFVPMDLQFISTSNEYLSLIASKSTALQNLLRYISQVQGLMINEFRSTQDLPSRFLGNVNETLAEKSRGDIVQAMYHSVATGHTFPEVKEWLVDELQERGHKRWDKAVVTGLENLRKLVHQHMLPALERCVLILSRLNGIAKFQGPDNSSGFSSRQIGLLLDTISCLKLEANKILTYTVEELDLFTTFSAWLRHEIDRLASDSLPSDELTEKESLIDVSKVLQYIQGPMMQSSLRPYFRDDISQEQIDSWDQSKLGRPMINDLAQQVWKQEKNPTLSSLPSVHLLCKQLNRQAKAIFEQIAEAEKRNVHFGQSLTLPFPGKDRPMAMRVGAHDDSNCHIFIATAPEKTSVHLFRLTLRIQNGISSVISKEAAAMILGDGRITDIAFLDDDTLLALWSLNDETPVLLSLPYRDATYSSYQSPRTCDESATRYSNSQVTSQLVKYSLPQYDDFIPQKLEVAGPVIEESSSKEGTRLCILSKDQLHYKVFTLTGTKVNVKMTDDDVAMSQ